MGQRKQKKRKLSSSNPLEIEAGSSRGQGDVKAFSSRLPTQLERKQERKDSEVTPESLVPWGEKNDTALWKEPPNAMDGGKKEGEGGKK